MFDRLFREQHLENFGIYTIKLIVRNFAEHFLENEATFFVSKKVYFNSYTIKHVISIDDYFLA